MHEARSALFLLGILDYPSDVFLEGGGRVAFASPPAPKKTNLERGGRRRRANLFPEKKRKEVLPFPGSFSLTLPPLHNDPRSEISRVPSPLSLHRTYTRVAPSGAVPQHITTAPPPYYVLPPLPAASSSHARCARSPPRQAFKRQ